MIHAKSDKKVEPNLEFRITGSSICPGIAIGTPFHFSLLVEEVPEFDIEDEDVEKEIERYRKALQRSKQEVQRLKNHLEKEKAWEGAAILDSHLHMMQDPLLTAGIEEQIRKIRKNTESIVLATINEYQKRFNKISDTFFQERFKDVQDVAGRIVRHLQESHKVTLADIPTHSVVFAKELAPSDTAEAHTTKIAAFVTERGGQTSHVAIMAKAQGIPYITNVKLPANLSLDVSIVIVDGDAGQIIFHPTKATLQHYKLLQKKNRECSKVLSKIATLPPETVDGYKVLLYSNVELFNELDLIHEHGGHGCGLFRSESLLLSQGEFPTEEEQFQFYKKMVDRMNGLPIVFRTFDIGGDKFGRFYSARREENPFLGCRAIRLMLKEKEIFKTQLKAILRASFYGPARIMFPMVSGLSELLAAKELLKEAKEELRSQQIDFHENISVGCMIEVPSAALTIDFIAKECDFLSIGTNDLVQYAIAVDRGNHAMSYLYTPTHPSILRMIKFVLHEAAHHQIPVTVCGEMAADPKFTQLILGLGVHALSLTPRALPLIKKVIRNTNFIDAVRLADAALDCTTPEEVHALLGTLNGAKI